MALLQRARGSGWDLRRKFCSTRGALPYHCLRWKTLNYLCSSLLQSRRQESATGSLGSGRPRTGTRTDSLGLQAQTRSQGRARLPGGSG